VTSHIPFVKKAYLSYSILSEAKETKTIKPDQTKTFVEKLLDLLYVIFCRASLLVADDKCIRFTSINASIPKLGARRQGASIYREDRRDVVFP